MHLPPTINVMESPSANRFPLAVQPGEQLRTVTMHWYTLPFSDTFRTGTDSEKLVAMFVLLRVHCALYSERA